MAIDQQLFDSESIWSIASITDARNKDTFSDSDDEENFIEHFTPGLDELSHFDHLALNELNHSYMNISTFA